MERDCVEFDGAVVSSEEKAASKNGFAFHAAAINKPSNALLDLNQPVPVQSIEISSAVKCGGS